MERGIKGSLVDLEEIFRYLLKALGDSIAVTGTQSDNLQDQHIEGSSEKFFGFTHNDT